MVARTIVMVVCLIAMMAGMGRAAVVERWGMFEVEMKGPGEGGVNPFEELTVAGEFTQGDKKVVVVPGFYDGGGVWRIRFSPAEVGQWKYVTRSNAKALDRQTGAVTVVPPTGANHGPVVVRNTYHFAYADGTAFYPVGTTCYAWTHQTEALQEETLKTLAGSPFNKLRMCVFPKSFAYNANDPVNYPFVKGADGAFDFGRFDVANWQHLEKRIGDLEKLGIQADVILFHPYDRWGFATMDKAADDRYVRYAIARLSAYRNVWWSLANEYDFMIPPLRAGQKGNKTVEDFDRFFSILEKEDPFDRLRSIHHAAKMYDQSKEWVTHASIQNRDLTQVIAWREKFKKPIVVDECRYEGNISQSWGNLTGPQMVSQFWVGTICGGYVGHGETIKAPEDVLWWAKGGVLRGESPARIAFLKKTMEALPYEEMTPAKVDANVYMLSKPGAVYLVYALKPGTVKVPLVAGKNYTVEAVDTWNMKAEVVEGAAKDGVLMVEAGKGDMLWRVVGK